MSTNRGIFIQIGIASIMLMPYLRGSRGVVAVPPEVLLLFGCLRCYDVRNIQILSTDRILFHGHEIHIHMNSLTKELSNCSPNVSFLMKVSVRVSGGFAQRRVCGLCVICLIFSRKFNLKRDHSVHQPPTLPQKIDSRGGLF